MEKLLDFEKAYCGKRVVVTGHTGFTGGWICTWLKSIGADVYGLALKPQTEPNMFNVLDIASLVNSHIGDICNLGVVSKFIDRAKPEIVFHLAAQPIVSVGYDDPHGTFNTNVMGTLNVLEAARQSDTVKAAVCITTDKVYDNKEWQWGYREEDPLGGKDPYSASKSACEMVIHTYQHALAPRSNSMLIASARGGNIIGGGDWAENRIVPDFVRAASNNEKLELRNPSATRPWQHVLALVHGYLLLGHQLLECNQTAVSAWNFGPTNQGEREVGELVKTLQNYWSDVDVGYTTGTFKESHYLHLTSERARKILGWNPPLDFEKTVEWTAKWYKNHFDDTSRALYLTLEQLQKYRASIKLISK